MPWREVSKMGEREEFVRLAGLDGANRRELCRRFGIHPDTGYKWLNRWQSGNKCFPSRYQVKQVLLHFCNALAFRYGAYNYTKMFGLYALNYFTQAVALRVALYLF